MYNVFKRPMFKRGGSATGTGIMSHVEPRVKAQGGGYQFFNTPAGKGLEGMAAYGPNAALAGLIDLGAVPLNTVGRMFGYNPGFSGTKAVDALTGGQFSKFTGYDPNVARFLGIPTSAKQGFAEGVMTTPKDDYEVSGGIAQVKPGETALDAVINRSMEKKQKPKITIPTNADEKQKEIFDMKKEIADETKFLKELLKDEGYDRGQAALILSAAIKEPGTIADKISKAVSLGAPLAAKKKEEEKAITLAAYKLAKEKEQQQIKAGKETDYIRNLRSMAASFVGSPEYKGKTQSEIFKDLLQSKTESSEVRNYLLKSAGKEITRSASEVMEKQKELSKLTPGTKAYDKKKAEIDIISNEIKNLYGSFPEFSKTYPNYGKLFGFKTGGRVMKAEGDLAETETDIITSNVSFGSPQVKDETVVEKPVEKLSYTQLRDRLPPEITDNVVQLLSTSEEALQDFAYIRTQEDVNAFNVKYGVNLVIPPTKG